jgi:hypothetical protein
MDSTKKCLIFTALTLTELRNVWFLHHKHGQN